MKRKLTFALIAFIFSSALYAQELNTRKLDSLLHVLAMNNKVTGSLAISRNGKIIYNGFIHSAGQQLKINSGTKFRIGSVTKMFTSVMIHQLIEEKKLKSDSPLSDFFPDLPNAKKITINHLLTHHSGLHSFTNDSAYFSYYTSPKTQKELLDLMKAAAPDFEPGSRAEYSNSNYVLLGYIIEKLDKRSYARSLEKRITKKIGLNDTYYGGKIDRSKNEIPSFSFVNDKWVEEKETDMSIPHGAGAVISTPSDLIRFIEALFSYKLISKESLGEMKTLSDQFGKGIFQFPFGSKTAYGHDGGIDGFITSLAYFPADSLSFAFTANGLNHSMNEILLGVLNIVFDKPYTIPTFASIKLSPEKLSAYEGVYASRQIPLKITIKREGDVLTGQATNQPSFVMDAQSESTFRFDRAGVTMIFSIQQDGTISTFVLKQGGGEYLFEKEK